MQLRIAETFTASLAGLVEFGFFKFLHETP